MKTKWRGYDLDEIRQRRLVNSVKIDIQRQMLAEQVKTDFSPRREAAGFLAGYFAKAVNWGEFIIIAIQSAKKVISIIKALRR